MTVSALRSHQRECGIGATCPICLRRVTQKRNLGKHMEKHKRDGTWTNEDYSNMYPIKLSFKHENSMDF